MDNEVSETIQFMQEALEPYIKPREEVSHIRRILSLHLHSFTDNAQTNGPLALVDESATATVTKENRGLEREYLRALSANLKARREFETVRKAQSVPHASHDGKKHTNPTKVLEDQLSLIKLRQKLARLETLHKHVDILSQQPTGSDDFIDDDSMFSDCRLLPEVPRKIVDSFAVDDGSGKVDLAGLGSKLEKVLLRSKLLLRREEQLLEEVKSRVAIDTMRISPEAKLHALEVTRNELISWIETELSNASGEDPHEEDREVAGDAAGGSASKEEQQQKAVKKQVMQRLDEVKEKYDDYVSARRTLILALSQPVTTAPKKPNFEPVQSNSAEALPQEPADHLLTPYLDALLALSREQKGLISHKSHFNITLAKQLKEASQTVDHLAAESQLLPKFTGPGTAAQALAKRGGGGSGGLLDDMHMASLASERPDLTGRVKPWAIAAESAKIATLEEVAERIEEGQMALEESMSALAEIDKLTGKPRATEDGQDATEVSAEDIWLEADKGAPKDKKRMPPEKKPVVPQNHDIWSVLDGSLGLLGHDGHGS